MNNHNHGVARYDLHRHLGGCVEPEFVYALAQKHKLGLSFKQVRKSLTFQIGDPCDFRFFLRKFDLLNAIPWDEEDINDLAHHVVAGLLRENISYSEIRLSLSKYIQPLGASAVKVARRLKESFDDAVKNTRTNVGLVLSIKFESTDEELDVASHVDDYGDCFVGIDFVGDETQFDVKRLAPVARMWRDAGLGVICHAGEIDNSENVRIAAEELGAVRIAHGVRVPEQDRKLLDWCRDRGICFDIAVTSNVLTGVVRDYRSHPARAMLSNGNLLTIGTDDPATYRTSLDREYDLIRHYWGVNDNEVDTIMRNSVRMALVNMRRQ
jgi:adenosine deaminase